MAVVPYPWVGAAFLICLLWSLYSIDLAPVTSVVSYETKAADAASASVSQYVDSQESASVSDSSDDETEETIEETEAAAVVDVPPTTLESDTDETNEESEEEETEQLTEQPEPSELPLILYAYSESETARVNLKFFISHGLHAAADFVFILNGDTDIASTIPSRSNIRIVHRPNDCYDLGAYAEVLTKNDLYKNYKRFIMLNASIRGPFVPHWAQGCWSDMYLGRLTDEVKLVGMTANCWPSFHVQSMIWATDITGISVLLAPSPATIRTYSVNPPITPGEPEEGLPPGINACFHDWGSAVNAEVGATRLVEAAGYKVDVMMSAFSGTENFEGVCDSSTNGDVLWDQKYYGTNVHPFDTIFIKSNRDIDPVGIERHTTWVEGRKYSSYDFCHAPSA